MTVGRLGFTVPATADARSETSTRMVRPRLRSRLTVAAAAASLVLIAGSWLAGSPARAAGTGVNLDQWASTALAWQNGDLNGNNSRYPEGGIVPFRLAIEGLVPGDHSIHLDYDFTAGGHKAYDFLATWNVTNHPGQCALSGGAISSMCPGLPVPTTFPFPADPFVANGLSVTAAMVYSGAPRALTIYGGTITSIGRPVHTGPVDGNSSADMLVRFHADGPAVLLLWGGHLAQSSFWDRAAGGPPDGAAQVSGAPWHMRTLQLDSAGNRNQDRSIQPSAIVGELPPFALSPSPSPTPATIPAPFAPGQAVPAPDLPAPLIPTITAPGTVPTPPPTTTEAVGATGPASPLAGAALALVAALAGALAGLRSRRPRSGRRV